MIEPVKPRKPTPPTPPSRFQYFDYELILKEDFLDGSLKNLQERAEKEFQRAKKDYLERNPSFSIEKLSMAINDPEISFVYHSDVDFAFTSRIRVKKPNVNFENDVKKYEAQCRKHDKRLETYERNVTSFEESFKKWEDWTKNEKNKRLKEEKDLLLSRLKEIEKEFEK